MTSFDMFKHYIFIDPNNINSNVRSSNHLNKIKKIHGKYYAENKKIVYWGYADIAYLIKKYDSVFYKHFLLLNTNYPAFIADIGRYVILYFYGGLYSDLKCICNKSMIPFIEESLDKGIVFIAETHPINNHRVRNTNIVSLMKKQDLLDETLQKIKYSLVEADKNSLKGPRSVWTIGSKTYIDLFKQYESCNIIRSPFVEKGYITFDSEIASLSRIKKWQTTEEHLFNIRKLQKKQQS